MMFTKNTLNCLLETIIDEYFDEDNTMMGLWEVIEYVKFLYEEEINTLDEGDKNI